MSFNNITRSVIESFAPCPAWENDIDGYVLLYPGMDETWPDFFDLNGITDEHKLWTFTRPIEDIAGQQQLCLEQFVNDYFSDNDSLLCQEIKDFKSKVSAGTENAEDVADIEKHITHSEEPCENYDKNYLAYRMSMCLRIGGADGINAIKDSSNYTELVTIAKNLTW